MLKGFRRGIRLHHDLRCSLDLMSLSSVRAGHLYAKGVPNKVAINEASTT